MVLKLLNLFQVIICGVSNDRTKPNNFRAQSGVFLMRREWTRETARARMGRLGLSLPSWLVWWLACMWRTGTLVWGGCVVPDPSARMNQHRLSESPTKSLWRDAERWRLPRGAVPGSGLAGCGGPVTGSTNPAITPRQLQKDDQELSPDLVLVDRFTPYTVDNSHYSSELTCSLVLDTVTTW